MQVEKTARFDTEQLINFAKNEGFTISRRLITDWVQRGLLGSPAPIGRGDRKGVARVWSGDQANLLLSLLTLRPQVGTWLNALANIPVSLWVYWGDDYVALPQVRRAMASWVGTYTRISLARGERSARQLAAQLAPQRLPKGLKGEFVEYMSDLAQNPEELDEPLVIENQLRQIMGSHTQVLGQTLHADTLANLISSRMRAAKHIKSFTDDQYRAAREMLRQTRSSYATSQPTPPADATIDEAIKQACIDLLTHLGLLTRRTERL